MVAITEIHGREILDSRGNPTLEVDVTLESGNIGRAAVPSGASTGSLEAFELRDNDPKRYHGKGVLKAAQAVNGEIADCLYEHDASDQVTIDELMIELDGTDNKSRLGANAILATSMAIAKAAALHYRLPLYQYLGGVYSHILPVPMMNIINGGVHADNLIDIQEFMIMPVSATSITDAIRMGAEVFHSLKKILQKEGFNTNTGDEGGFAPNLNSPEQALDFIMNAIERSGYKPFGDIRIALDVAASEFYVDGNYNMQGMNQKFTSDQLINFYDRLISNYPICSIEDPMSELDFEGWAKISQALGERVQIVGDDLFVTNSQILEKFAKQNIANAVLIKPNQIGTISETLRTVEIAHKYGYKAILSHRSGETEDTTIAHLAVATNCGQIKTGSLCRSDRTAKYNELIRIEEKLGNSANYALDFA